jgi:hypothetical protein
MSASQGVCGRFGSRSGCVRPSTTAAQTIVIVNIAVNGMSIAAAWEKPIIPTVVGKSSRSHRAASAP